MKREITVDGKPIQIEITDCPVGSPFSIKVNDKTSKVTLEQEPNSAKGFTVNVNGKSYRINVSEIERNAPFSVTVNNVPFKVEFKTLNTTPKFTVAALSPVSVLGPKPKQAVGEGAVVAPMAGKIIKVRVKKGDTVKMGSSLCVLEAMKMENDITAPKNGVVEEVKAQEGKAVNEGDVLVLIK